MSGLLFLSIDDFKSQHTAKGSLMCSEISGFSLSYFTQLHVISVKK